MEKKITVFALVAVLGLLTSCDADLASSLSIMSGTLSWARQDWPAAAASFLETAALSRSRSDTELEQYALYGLATTYLSQNEYNASSSKLKALADTAPLDLLGSVWYQSGIVAYQGGDYERAAFCFRSALQYESAAIDAKINLEICLRAAQEQQQQPAAGNSAVSEREQPSLAEETIYDFIRKKEQDRWQNREDTPRASLQPDY